VCESLRQDFDRDVALELRVPRAIHLAHAAHPDLGSDFMWPEAGASSESHGKWLRL
jgi:hypothetical protein